MTSSVRPDSEIEELRKGFLGYCKEAGFSDVETAGVAATASLLGGDISRALKGYVGGEEFKHRPVAGSATA